MKQKLNGILLVDDDDDCNFFHERVIEQMGCTEQIHIAYNGKQALDFLTRKIDDNHPTPELILLDINMPGMDGWEFLDAYQNFDKLIKANIVLVMLTSSTNPDDRERALGYDDVNGFINKYLEREEMQKMLRKNFPAHF